ncbi:hypothetical protein PFISCL1PPCAC_1836, partial [Pristionchus fissidentatus]
ITEMASLDGVKTANEFIRSQLKPTPIMTSSAIDEIVGCKILFKSEHLQKTGSFKARGALHNIKLMKERGKKGVVTHSSGNHGQALAWAARNNGIDCTVVIPEGASQAKVDAIVSYGARVIRCKNSTDGRVNTCNSLAESEGLDIIDPHQTIETIEGQGSLGLEIKEQLTSIPPLFIAIGGGGMAAGIALALPHSTIYLVETEGKNLTQQLDESEEVEQSGLNTIADGIRTRVLGDENRRILKEHRDIRVITVSEDEIRDSLSLIWTRLKQHVEPTAAVPLAGLRKARNSSSPLPFNEALVILCGGNVDTSFT